MTDQSSERHFGWFLPAQGELVDFGRATKHFSQENWDEFQRIVSVTGVLRPFVIDYLSLQNDFIVLNDVEAKIVASLEEEPQMMQYIGVRQTRALALGQGALSNFLSSTSALKYRAETRLREKYGKDSLELKKLIAAQRDAYDASFAYRLFHNLRNYAQHHDIPISTIPVNAQRDDAGKMRASIQIVIRPQDLLESSLIQKSFREKELVHHTADLVLLPLAKEAFVFHGAIFKAILDLYVDRLVEMQHYGRVIFSKMGMPDGATPVIWEGPFPNAQQIHFSFDEFALIHKLYEHWAASGVKLGPAALR